MPNATGRTARGTGTRRQIGTDANRPAHGNATAHRVRTCPQIATASRHPSGGMANGCRLLPRPAHGEPSPVRQTVAADRNARTLATASRNATGHTARGTGNAGRRTLAPMCPADRNARAGGCRPVSGDCARTVSEQLRQIGRPSGAPCPARSQQGEPLPDRQERHGAHGRGHRASRPARSPRAARQTVAADRNARTVATANRPARSPQGEPSGSCPNLSGAPCPARSPQAHGRRWRQIGTARRAVAVALMANCPAARSPARLPPVAPSGSWQPVRQIGTPRGARRGAQERGGRSGQTRTRPADWNARAGGCRPVSGDCASTVPAPLRQIGTANRCRMWRTADGNGQRQTTAASDRQRRAVAVALMAECPNLSPSGGCPARSAQAARQDRHGKPERHRAHGAGQGDAAADRHGREPVRQTGTQGRAVAVALMAKCPADGGEIGHGRTAWGTGRGGRSGRARTRPAHGNATAHPCRLVSGDVPAPCPAHGRVSGKRWRGRSERPHHCHGKPSGEIATGGAADRNGERLPDVAHGRRARETADRDGQAGRTRQTTAASDRQRRARFKYRSRRVKSPCKCAADRQTVRQNP